MIIEVVSPSSQRMDYVIKIARYKEVGVREYWIIDPETRWVTVYRYDTASTGPSAYTLNDAVPVGIFPGLSLTIAMLVD